MARTTQEKFENRKVRTRHSIKKHNKNNRIRLSVFRSNKHIYAQLIDDEKGLTLASASTVSESLKAKCKSLTVESAKLVGEAIAQEAKKLNISKVVFDKGAYKFHGRVKALADGAKEANILDF